MKYHKQNKIIRLAIYSLLLLVNACRPDVDTIKIIYPDHNYFIGQTLPVFKKECNCILAETDNDGGKKNHRYFTMEDSINNTHIKTNVFLTFYRDVLVSFNCKFESIDSSENINVWATKFYSILTNNNKVSPIISKGNTIFKELSGHSFSLLAINGNASNFSNSVYLIGDYRYKEIDWD